MSRDGDADPEIRGAAGIADAGDGDITFAEDARRAADLADCGAAAAVVGPGVDCHLPTLQADDPRAVFARILELFAPDPDAVFAPGIHPTAVIHENARLGDVASVGPYAVVGDGAKIGDGARVGAHVVIEAGAEVGAGSVLHAHVTVRERCRLGCEVILHSGVVIGSDGFGYHPGPAGLVRIPQIGVVVLEDRVEIGANSCVDRATTGVTRIKAGTKIDNLVQIAHNVCIGANTAISAQTGISGSSVIGDGVVMGGQVGMGDHLTVGDGVKVAAQSGVTRDLSDGETVFGTPAVEFKRAFRLVALTHRLPDFQQRLTRLERIVDAEDEES